MIRIRVILGLLGFYAAIHAGVTLWTDYAPSADPHAFMRDPKRCIECHIEAAPEKGRAYKALTFRRDTSSLCSRCHSTPFSHPVDVVPGKGISNLLPLDPDGAMTCVTCHAPHGTPTGNTRMTGRTLWQKIKDTAFPFTPPHSRTYFLRLPTTKGELCEACHAKREAARPSPKIAVPPPDPKSFAGSKACRECHPGQYRLWSVSPHARMLRSPRKQRQALLADFTTKPPFPTAEIAYILGSRNVQRFVSRKDEKFVVRTPIWLIRAKEWNLSYWREMDWLTMCAGCHTTGFDPFSASWAEESVGCEACHGPAVEHAKSGGSAPVVNPAKLSADRRAMICEACHTTGHDATGEFRFPVGFVPGDDLKKFYFGLVPKPGQDDATFAGDGSPQDRRRQYQFWEERMLIAEGETCDLCKNFRIARKAVEAEAASKGPKKMMVEEFCLSCHDGVAATAPTYHAGGPAAKAPCLSCHPVAGSSTGTPSIHDHKYVPSRALAKNDFIPPTDFRSICFRCHPTPK